MLRTVPTSLGPAASALRAGAVAAALSLLVTGSALAGPPWISVEIPANPNMREARGALVLVRAYHHDATRAYRVTGVAEGIVEGERRSVPLRVGATSQAGLYTVAPPTLETGRWILVLTLEGGDTDASALVKLTDGGEVSGVRVPVDRKVEGFTVPRRATEAEIEAMLREGELVTDSRTSGAPLAATVGLLALAVGIPILRSRRRG
ncbi:MAG: hypothetical protein R3326_02010 [Gemmatimonadota bacterium]|nr:hypothetical protein [Gemmatimonadota bacterium]